MKIFHFCANHTNIGDRISADGILSMLHQNFPQNQYFRLFCDIENLPGLLAETGNFPEVRRDVARLVSRNIRMADEIAADPRCDG